MAQIQEDDDRETALYHGTTLDAAQLIVAQRKFESRGPTFFSSTREVAEFFAVRSSEKRSRSQAPAVVRVVLYESDLKDWEKGRHVVSKGFDDGDAAALYGKTQISFSAEGIRLLNTYMFGDAISLEVLQQTAQR